MAMTPRHALFLQLSRDVFGSMEKRRQDYLDELVGEQIKLTSNGTLGFIHRGEYYFHSSATPKTVGKRIERLHRTLRKPLDDFLANEKKIVRSAQPVVEGYLRAVLLKTLHKDSLFKLLPQSVHPTVCEWHETAQIENHDPDACIELSDAEVGELIDSHAEAFRLMKTFKVRTMIMS